MDSFVICFWGLDNAQHAMAFLFFLSYWPIKNGALIYSVTIWEQKSKDSAPSGNFQHKLQHTCFLFGCLPPIPSCLRYYWIGHFRVPKTLTFKMRPGAQPFLWKWVLFAWEWKMISISKAEHLPSFWNRGPGGLVNGLLCRKLFPRDQWNKPVASRELHFFQGS